MGKIEFPISVYELRAILVYLQAEEQPDDPESRKIIKALVAKIKTAIKKADSEKMTTIVMKDETDFQRQQNWLFCRIAQEIGKKFSIISRQMTPEAEGTTKIMNFKAQF
jgi:hypothetical protein